MTIACRREDRVSRLFESIPDPRRYLNPTPASRTWKPSTSMPSWTWIRISGPFQVRRSFEQAGRFTLIVCHERICPQFRVLLLTAAGRRTTSAWSDGGVLGGAVIKSGALDVDAAQVREQSALVEGTLTTSSLIHGPTFGQMQSRSSAFGAELCGFGS